METTSIGTSSDHNSAELSFDDLSDRKNPIVIYCQPNASFYEFLYWADKWILNYKKRNINIFLWNYRSYSQSEGSINTKDTLRDGEVVFDYVA